jgi:PilZ domain
MLVVEVTGFAESTVLNSRSSEVSRTGCYIDTLNPVPPGAQVRVRLRQADEVFETGARVAYICPGLGMGITFDKNAPDHQWAILDRWLAKAASSES